MTTTQKRRWRSAVVNLALVALAFGLLALVIRQNRDEIHKVFDRSLDWKLLAIALLIYMIGLVSTFVRWYLLVRVIDSRFTLRAAVLLGLFGNFFNLMIPGAVGGDLLKAAYLARMRIKKTQAIASMVIDRILGLLGLFMLATIAGATIYASATSDVRGLIVAAWVFTALGLLLLAMIFGQVVTRLFPGLGQGHSRMHVITTELKEMSATYTRRLDVVGFCGLMAMGNHTLNVVAFYLVGRMLFPSMTTTLAQHFLMVPLTLFTMAVPIPFGALGLSEGAAHQVFKLVNHPSGSLAMMGFRVLMFAGAAIGMVVYLLRIQEARALTQTAHEIEDEIAEGEIDEEPETNEPDAG